MVVELISSRDLKRARELVLRCGLSFEENFDTLVGIFDGRGLAAVGARDANIFKMLAVDPTHQGGGLLGDLVTELLRLGFQAGFDSFYIFTRPESAVSFHPLNFQALVTHPRVHLLEYGGGLRRYLEAHRHQVRPGANGAVVVNCNPFTRGHRYLIEEAARKVDRLYVFVVREDRSVFPFEVRYRLVREGTADLENVTVLDSSHFAVSHLTFPGYFLGEEDSIAELQMEIDLLLFGRHIAPFFNIRRRFVGTEPYCRTTRLYGQAMKRVLAPLGVETEQLERQRVGEEAVSAYRVRQAIRREAYESLRRLLPPTTLEFILSEQGRPLREKLQARSGRH